MIYNSFWGSVNSHILMQSKFRQLINQGQKAISDLRKKTLDQIAGTMRKALKENNEVVVKFICTHNSRRSQTAEFMLDILAREKKINLIALSAGTEFTAFNPAMVKALESWGFNFIKYGEDPNPLYIYNIGNDDLYYYSKVYSDELIEYKNIINITVCGDADENCPLIPSSYARFHLGYKDPKVADGTAQEEEVYANKVVEIGSEMMYLIESVTA